MLQQALWAVEAKRAYSLSSDLLSSEYLKISYGLFSILKPLCVSDVHSAFLFYSVIAQSPAGHSAVFCMVAHLRVAFGHSAALCVVEP